MNHRRCDARCLHAISEACSCQCGGKNHGKGHTLDPDTGRPRPVIRWTRSAKEPDENPAQLALL